MKKVKIKSREEVDREIIHSLIAENSLLKKKLYVPLQRDKQIKEIAVEFSKMLVEMYKPSEWSKGKFTMDTNMAPGMLSETIGEIYDRFMFGKSMEL